MRKNLNAIIEYGSPKKFITIKLSKLADAHLTVCGAIGLNAVERLFRGLV